MGNKMLLRVLTKKDVFKDQNTKGDVLKDSGKMNTFTDSTS